MTATESRALVGDVFSSRGDGSDDSPSKEVASKEIRASTDDRFPRWFGFLVILLAFGFAGGWSALASIDGAVVAPGTVTVDLYRKTVQHLEGGIVVDIHVRDGDRVEAGDLLIQLDETRARATYLVRFNQYLAALARMARLEAELKGIDRIVFPEALTQEAGKSSRAERVIATEEREFLARREAREGEISVLRQRLDQIGERILGIEAQRAARLRTIGSLKEELASRGRLAERELIPAADLRPIERELADAEGQAGELLAAKAMAEVEIGETELRIIQIGYDFQREVASSLRETSVNIDALEEELLALEDELRRKAILAPVTGEVVDLQVHTLGAVIGSGDPILDLVPANQPLVIEARVRPQDVDNVTEGMPADVRFTAFSFRTTPVVEGHVVFVSADRLEDPSGNREPYFLTRIVVSEEQIRELGPISLRPGMPADVMIKTGERTPLQYLLKPLMDGLARSFTED